METKVLLITPEMAKSFLRRNTCNRPINSNHVSLFEAMLERGEIQLTHQGIAISESGTLLDGQHRLLAIAGTGISTKMMVTTGLPDAVFAVLDSGSKRKAADILAIDGARNATAMASAIRLYILYTETPNNVWTGKVPVRITSTTRIDNKYCSDKETWQWAAAISANALPNVIIPGAMACLLYLALKQGNYSCSFIEGFVAQLKMGNDLSPGNPLLAYRNKMIGQSRPSAQARLADYIKLFNAYSTKQQLKIFKSQMFPPMPTIIDSAESLRSDDVLP